MDQKLGIIKLCLLLVVFGLRIFRTKRKKERERFITASELRREAAGKQSLAERFGLWLAGPVRRKRIARRIKVVNDYCEPSCGVDVFRETEFRIYGDSIVDWAKAPRRDWSWFS